MRLRSASAQRRAYQIGPQHLRHAALRPKARRRYGPFRGPPRRSRSLMLRGGFRRPARGQDLRRGGSGASPSVFSLHNRPEGGASPCLEEVRHDRDSESRSPGSTLDSPRAPLRELNQLFEIPPQAQQSFGASPQPLPNHLARPQPSLGETSGPSTPSADGTAWSSVLEPLRKDDVARRFEARLPGGRRCAEFLST